MTLLSDEARRDIAHKFELPERKSKIASLIKQNDTLYCICRSTDSTRFMIACDSCDEWFHADCVNLTKAESASIKRYYCPFCTATNPKLKTVYKGPKLPPAPKGSSERTKADSEAARRKRSSAPSSAGRPPKKVLTEKKAFKCTCDGQHRSVNCGKCSGCARRGKCIDPKCKGKKIPTLSDEDYNSSDSNDSESEDSEPEPSPIYIPPQPKVKTTPQKGKDLKKKPIARKPAARVGGGGPGKRQYRRRAPIVEIKKPEKESSSDEETVEFGKGPRQCYGPSCTQIARPNSKYCQDFCGIALSYARIYAILPVRLTDWSLTPVVANAFNEAELVDVRQKYDEASKEIKYLLDRRNELDRHLVRVREIELNSDSSDEDHDEDGMMYCVTCGHEISMKTCLKHMEKCFNKYEGKTTFGSLIKQGQIDGPALFCDSYNPVSKTYCKRLAVLCAEHVKQGKIGEKELCGYPLNELTDKHRPFEKFCRVRKKKCNSHFSWEKLRRASIDMQRVRMYSRMDELMEKDVRIRTAQENRGSLMSLLLNSTFDHELAEREKMKKEGGREESAVVVKKSVRSGEVNLSEESTEEDEESSGSSPSSPSS